MSSDQGKAAMAGPRLLGVQRHPVLEVPVQARGAADISAISPIPGWATDFSAHGGVVMYNPRVFAIYWGRDYGTPATGTNNLVQEFDAFFAMVLNSTFMDFLSQYNVNRGTFLGSTWVDHDPGTQETLSESDIAQRLSNWLDAGMTPVRPVSDEHDLLFVIFAPTEVTLTNQGHSQNDPVFGFCGYHHADFYQKSQLFGQSNLFWAIITPGSGTAVVSHELCEAFTDRDFNGWYSDNAEIGDACNACSVGILSLNGFQVASYWLVNSDRCLQQTDLTPPPPRTGTVPDVVTQKLSPAQARAKIVGAGFGFSESVDPIEGNFKPYAEDQDPGGGTVAVLGTTVNVTIAIPHKGPPP
jgi:hypothetical protein